MPQSSPDITHEDICMALEEWSFGFARIDPQLDHATQYVYRAVYHAGELSYPGDIHVDWYTTVDVESGQARPKGNDSMKLRFIDVASGDRAAPTQRLYRTTGWAQNLRSTMLTFLSWTQSPPLCPECESVLVHRSGTNGFFWGCTAYDGGDGCQYTAPTAAYSPFEA